MKEVFIKDIIEIRTRAKAGGITQKELAKEFGVPQGKISRIVNSHTYK